MNIIRQADLLNADLLVEHIYEGGRSGNASDDPLPLLLGVSNQGGFRYTGTKDSPRLVVLTSTFKDPNWPDNLDRESGVFTYYGDNKKPGHELHDTPRFGNLLLRDMFERAHGSEQDRAMVPPVLLFANTGSWRDVLFLGLALPGAQNLDANHDLVAVWKLKDRRRFQNYQAVFTVLDVAVVSRKWLEEVKRGNWLGPNCPKTWKMWVEKGLYRPLKAPRALEYRTRDEQLPEDAAGMSMLAAIQDYFGDNHTRFEACAARIAELMMPSIATITVTRPVKDGGRDALGKYRIGEGASAVLVDFSLEAKCYGLANSVGVKELSRLISRLRHRQFGVLVTTSFVGAQAYQEIKEDEHPIVIISGGDIIRLLRTVGITTKETIEKWLSAF